MCTLRNISYKIDVEIDRNVYLDAVQVPVKHTNNSPQLVSRDQNLPTSDNGGDSDSMNSKGSDKNTKNKVLMVF